jgi:glycerol-3-phosphate dehydrogenase (NAD(P)+)
MPTTFAVLGSGAWGTTVALLLARNPAHRVRLWCTRPESATALRGRRENTRFLPGVPLPDSLELTDDIAHAAAGADLWVAGIPTVYLRPTLKRAGPPRPGATPVLSLAKGIEIATFKRPTEILAEMLGTDRLAVLSGPSHAEEVSRGLPTSVVAASTDLALASQVQQWFSTDRFRVYTNRDVLGVELAGALKNVIAIAAGICDGLKCGDNAKAALLTRGIVEMARFGVSLGADQETFFGLAGIGDLITTCSSQHGRNRRVGERLAAGEKLEPILGSTAMVAEGVYTAKSVYERTRATGVEMPIVSEVYRVLYEGKSPRDAVTALMLRPVKLEGASGVA